ncbi:aldo-keto reductase family 1 member B1-like [Neocloeon triangulifer]|uniref:aldo-keto reductase family 1 member B1-like n=1 Tax=Neocloeon triangulifer TaxID=2078957 RepID=UPI00286F6BFB|nr:aldo-keto reductase family 1 member B1-like [Neocloeon triangulifer]
MAVPLIKLNNGLTIPAFGLGTWKSKPGQVEAAVEAAIDAGYRHIDCAHIYENESEVGAAIAKKIKEGVVRREDLFITSKLWNTDHDTDRVVNACRKTLKHLQLDYLDLYLIHWPMAYKGGDALMPRGPDGNIEYSQVHYTTTWLKMEECVRIGLTKSIGLSNFNSVQIDEVLKVATIRPVALQVELHPYLPQVKLQKFCADRGIILTGYSPLGSPDRPWAKAGDPDLLNDPRVKTIADKHNKSPAQILLRYQIERGVSVIPKSVTKARIIENFSIFDFKLSKEEVDTLTSFDCNGRLCGLDSVKDHPLWGFNIEY